MDTVLPLARPVSGVRLRWLAGVAAAAALLGNLVAQGIVAARRPGDDFSVFWGAGRALMEGHALYGSSFLNPPVVALAFTPLSRLPLRGAAATFAILSALMVLGGGWLLVTRLRCSPWVVALAALSMPAAWAVRCGQLDPLLFGALVGALILLARRPFLAGLLLSVLAVKVQAVWLVPVALLVLGRWRVLLGMGLGAALLAGSTLAILGSGWDAWPQAMLSTGGAQEPWSIGLPTLAASLYGPAASVGCSVLVALSFAAGAFTYRRQLRLDPALTVAAAVCLGLLVSPHVLCYDLVLVAPALALAGRRHPVVAGIAAGWLSVTYLLAGAAPATVLGLNPYLVALTVAVAAMLVAVGTSRAGTLASA